MKHKLAIPEALLIAQMLLLGIFVSRHSPHSVPDTPSYSEFPFDSLVSALNHHRTPGYPILLRCVRLVSADYAALPLIQYALWCLAVGCFWWGLGLLRISRWHRAWVCFPLLYADILQGNVDTLATDTVAAATCVALVGCLIRLETSERVCGRLVMGISLLCFAACLIRPASLFLIPFVPVVGAILTASRVHAACWSAGLKRGGLLLGVVCVPVLSYSLLRWLVIGQFGLVSFGGHNLIGIAGQWMDEAAISSLPAESQPLARIARKRQLAWEEDHPLRPGQSRMQYSTMEERYDPHIWIIFEPAALEHFGNDPAKVNAGLRQLAQALIRIRPRNYLLWLAKASRQSVRVVAIQLASNPVVLLYVLLWITGELGRLRRSISGGNELPSRPATEDPTISDCDRMSEILLLVAMSFLILSTMLIVLVCTPIGRLMDAAAVLVPVVIADRVARTWQRLTVK